MKVSLHIGVNKIDKRSYGDLDERLYGQIFRPLNGCVQDAEKFRALAKARGFIATPLHDDAATASAVLEAIEGHAAKLAPADLLFVTYSGHGAQIPGSPDVGEDDGCDETWVLHDRQLIDGELSRALAGFVAGVRVFVASDSCSSGTALRLDRGARVGTSRLGERPYQADEEIRSRFWPWKGSPAGSSMAWR